MTRKHALVPGLLVGALGVVFGDIGTSPLYAVKVIFGQNGQFLPVSELTVYGILSLIVWTVTIVVTIKYIGFMMRAENKGEGGIMALVARTKTAKLSAEKKALLATLGIIGVAFFYGDSAITPAISVLSAVEGLNIMPTNVHVMIIPITLAVISGLFWLQHYGTAVIGRLFGPVMVLWFGVLAAGGLAQVIANPHILNSLNPLMGLQFIHAMPLTAFIAMGAVVLAVTGAEALYADMGHFGREPIKRAWLLLVFPALMLSYLGQGSQIVYDPSSVNNPFFLMYPSSLQVPLIILATLATVIASQSVISGAFSLTRQAVQMNFLPRMLIYQTSVRTLGQVYVPLVNILLFIAVTLFVLLFGTSEKLAGAYGIAVSGALMVDSLLLFAVARAVWPNRWRQVRLVIAGFLLLDLILVTANLPKILHGGWAPLMVAVAVLVIITVWRHGQTIIRRERRLMEGTLTAFVEKLHNHQLGSVNRIPGQAVFIGHHPGLAPLALHDSVDNLHELPQKLVIVYVKTSDAAHVPEDSRAVIDELMYRDGIAQVTLTFGFHDQPNVPHALSLIRGHSPEMDFDPYQAAYFVSLTRAVITARHNMPHWQKRLFELLDRNKLSASDYYKLPIDKTTELRTLIKL